MHCNLIKLTIQVKASVKGQAKARTCVMNRTWGNISGKQARRQDHLKRSSGKMWGKPSNVKRCWWETRWRKMVWKDNEVDEPRIPSFVGPWHWAIAVGCMLCLWVRGRHIYLIQVLVQVEDRMGRCEGQWNVRRHGDARNAGQTRLMRTPRKTGKDSLKECFR